MSEEPIPGLAGRTIGQYEILHEIGRGGMATVYLARQISIGRDVAIKVLPDHLLTDEAFMQRFAQEVRVIADLQHPRVLPVYDFGELAHRPYIVMAYMAGGTLADRLRTGLMPLPEVVRVVEQVAEGLDHAHRKGVIHRDFKPSNILLDMHGNAYLADFGLAKVAEASVSLTGSNIVGTPSYMAPEIGSPDPVTSASDRYSLGITLYQMLTGDVPFRAQTPLEVMMAHSNEPVPDITEFRPDLPAGTEAVLWRALAKDPADRYPTAGALAADLRRVLAAGGEVHADPAEEPARPFNPPTPAAPKTVQLAGGGGSTWEGGRTTGIPPVGDWVEADDEAAPMGESGEEANPGCRWGLLVVLGGLLAITVLIVGGLLAFANGWWPFMKVAASQSSYRGGAMAGAGVQLAINNELDMPICEVQIKLSLSSDWGSNQLGEGRQVVPGSAYTVTGIPPGEYDYRALDCNRDVLDAHYSVALPEGRLQPWSLFPANSTLTVQNDSHQSVCSVYVSAPSDGAWRGDKLGGGEALPPGESLDVAVAAGSWDLRAEACDGGVWEAFEQVIEGRRDWVLTDADLTEQ